MRIQDAVSRPATASACLASILITLAYWADADVSGLTMSYRAFAGEPWRLLTATLLHANALHLVFNVYWMWILGGRIESRAGFLATAGTFVVLGAGSSAAEFVWGVGGIGLSGVVYGLFGLLWIADRRSPSWRGTMDGSTTKLFVVWFFFCIAATVTGILPIGNVAHGSGAVLGAALGLTVDPKPGARAAGWALTAALLVLCLLAASVGRPLLNRGESMAYEHLQRAHDAYAAGDPREAEAAVERAWELAPDDPDVRSVRALCLFRQGYDALVSGSTRRSIELYEEAVALDGKNAGAWFNLGVAHGRLAQWDEARRSFRRALEVDPGIDGAREALAEIDRYDR